MPDLAISNSQQTVYELEFGSGVTKVWLRSKFCHLLTVTGQVT